MMKNTRSMLLTLLLSAGIVTGCAEKELSAEKPKEAAAQSLESAGEKPAEVKEKAPAAVAETKKKVEKKKPAAAPGGAGEKTLEKPAATGKVLEAGAAIFKSKCLPCHGADGKGTALAPAFKGNDWVKGASNGEIADVIRNGRQGPAKKYTNFVISMPATKEMPENDVNALIEYIRSINPLP